MKKLLFLFVGLLFVFGCTIASTKELIAEEHKIGDITFEAWDKDNSLPNADGSYYLTKDVTLSETWWTNKETNIDLNGHTVTSTVTNTRFARVGDATQTTLTSITSIYDSVGTGKITGVSTSHVVFEIASPGTLNLYGGSIDGNTSSNQYGVIWINGGVLNVDGGKISGNNETNSDDKGIVNNNGTLNIKSGEISNNNTSGKYIIFNNPSKTVNISGGKIKNNSASSAIIRSNGSAIIMTDGEISGNHNNSAYCGPIWINNGKFDLSGGTISKNYNAAENENGSDCVYVATNAFFNMTGGYIKDHCGTKKNPIITLNSSSGSVGTFNMSGGEISGNTSKLKGIIWPRTSNSVTAAFNLTGGSIINNTVEGGVSSVFPTDKAITISGNPVIRDNSNNLAPNENNLTFGALTSGADIYFNYDTSWGDYKKVAHASDTSVANYVHTTNDCITSAVDAGFLQLRWVKVSKITLNETSLNMEKNDTFQLTGTIAPTNTYKKDIVWSTADATVATVSESGLVTAVGDSGSTIITATVKDRSKDSDNKVATCTVTVKPISTEVNAQLNADGTINMNFSTKINSGVADDDAYFEINGVKTKLNTLTPTTNPDGSKQYEVSAPVMSPKQMTDKISMVVRNGDGSAVSEEVEITIQDYLNVLATTDNNFKNLAKSMLNYGAYAQIYFDYNATNLANSVLEEGERSVASIVPDVKYKESGSGTTDGASICGTSLNLNSTTNFNVYFDLTNDVDKYSVSVDGVEDELVATNTSGRYFVKIKDVAAPNLANSHTVVVKHNGSGDLTYTGSVLSYAYNAITNHGTTKANLANCMRAMYKYAEEAKKVSE